MRRDTAATVLAVLAALLTVVALPLGYVRHTVLDDQQFAARAAASLSQPAVRDLVGRSVTDQLVRTRSNLLAARPLLQSVTSGIVGSPPFAAIFRTGVADLHRAVIERDHATATLTLVDVGTLVHSALAVVSPDVARRIDGRTDVALLHRRTVRAAARLARLAEKIRAAALVAVLAALLAGLGSVLLARRRRAAVERLATGLVVAGLLVAAACVVLRLVVTARAPSSEARAAARAVWDAFFGDLRNAGLLLAGCGAVGVGVARGLVPVGDVRPPLARARTWLFSPAGSPRRRAARALVLVALGLALLTARAAVLSVALMLAGVVALAGGVGALVQLAAPPAAEPAPAEPDPARRARPGRRWWAIAACGAATLAVAATVLVFLDDGGVTTAAATGTGTSCNGSAALCDRRLDQVVFPATHNSMSAPLPGWFAPVQERSIARQLNDGIRGLLIDTHYGDRLPDGRVRTELSEGTPERGRYDDEVGPEAVAAALRLRERLGFRGEGKRGIYLCHSFCELGSTPLASVLDDVRTFLVSHPRDVLIVVNQDAITPRDFVGAVREAGLADYAYAGPGDKPWPTLGEMVDSGKRLVLLAENKAGAAPWYQLAYEGLVQETPFQFAGPAALTDPARRAATCRPNRGGTRGKVFLVNHWINTDPVPRPSNAAKINADKPLLARARACEAERDRVPTLLAVDFYREGALFRVARTLNGERPPG